MFKVRRSSARPGGFRHSRVGMRGVAVETHEPGPRRLRPNLVLGLHPVPVLVLSLMATAFRQALTASTRTTPGRHCRAQDR
jgi:hypothetical protein